MQLSGHEIHSESEFHADRPAEPGTLLNVPGLPERGDGRLPVEPPRSTDSPAGGTPDSAESGTRIASVLKDGFRWLRFPADLEAAFIRDTHEERGRHHMRMLLASLLIYNSFVLMDRHLMPDIGNFALMIRLIINGAALVVVAAIYFGLSYSIRETAIAGSGFVAGATVVLFMLKSASPLSYLYCMVLPLFIIYANIVQRARFWYALCSSLALLLLSWIGLGFVSSVTQDALQVFVLTMGSTVAFTLASLYKLEHDERAQYLLRSRQLLLVSELGMANERLDRLSRTDALTGLANRRGFEEMLQASWASARDSGDNLSLLMLDIDYFKRYNDHYGHPGGDQCLRRVASAIRAALRYPNDFAARYGGEEFAVILPRTDETMALGVGERVRQAVLGIDLLHDRSEVARVVTVSVGVATARADHPALTLEALIAAADQALYRAKTEGRNRVVPWPSQP